MGSADVTASRLFESLPARPPTPPRELHHDHEAPLKQVLFLDPRTSLQTPPSLHSPQSRKPGSSGGRKRVEFSTEPRYQEPPTYHDSLAATSGLGGTPLKLVVIPPSSSASRPAKSILKATSYEPSALSCDSTQPASPVSIADMLASTVQQLAGADRDSKLDAYLTLSRALKASDNLPDRIALQSKMSLFTQFIQRDITTKAPSGSVDSSLVIAALDLLNTFLRFSAIASTLSSDFGVFIIDHCIRSFEVVEVPRTVLRALMRVVGLQSFPARVMTSDRVGRLVVALHKMEDQMESRNTLLLRCMIYRTLVRNHRAAMAQHLDWLPDLFTDMLSTASVIRDAAINLGLDAAFALARERSVTQRVMELLLATADDQKYFEYYAGRLLKMTKDRDESMYVPQIWSVITLFIRTPDKWDYFVPWLRIIQGCFNSGDYGTKVQANYAWGRISYTIMREYRMPPTKMVVILTKALASQLRRRGTGKAYNDHRRVVIGTICNLFYYALRPNSDARALDSVWDNSVKTILLQLLEPPAAADTQERCKENRETACALLTGLVSASASRPWQEDHITKNPLVLPEELPAIDAKWIRRNSERVFSLLGPIMEQSFLHLSTPRSSTQTLWRAVVGAVAVAAAKEVKVSTETAVFVGHAFSLLWKLWTGGISAKASDTDQDTSFIAKQFLAATREYLLTMVDSLGSLPFTEKQFSRDDGNAFVVVSTPTQRLGKNARSPLHHLFSILSTLPPGIQDNDEFADFVESVFAPFFSSKSTKGCRNLALDLLQTIPMDAQCPYGPWQIVAKYVTSSIEVSSTSNAGNINGSASGSKSSAGSGSSTGHLYFHPSTVSGSDGPVGYQFREVVRVLERGLRSTPGLPFARWQALFSTLCDRVREETGDAGLALCVLDPLAKIIADLHVHASADRLLPAASRALVELLSSATQPRDRQAVEAARRRLWGAALPSAGSSSSFDPLDHVYKTVNLALEQQYLQFRADAPSDLAGLLLTELQRFFTRGNSLLFVKTLALVQNGLSFWIRDDNARLSQQSTALHATIQIWDGICSLLEQVSTPDSMPLALLEPLFCASFSSKHRHVVNKVLALWTAVYTGFDGSIAYPERLKAALANLQPFVDVAIPGVDSASIDPSGARQPIFVDSQEDAPAIISISSTSSHSIEVTTPKAKTPTISAPSPVPIPLSLSVNAHAGPLAATTSSSVNSASSGQQKARMAETKKTRVAHPRHQDSQIEFTSIDAPELLPSTLDTNDDVEPESQVLTDRQREVRDRQRGLAALYSDVFTSSPGRDATKAWNRPKTAEATRELATLVTQASTGGQDLGQAAQVDPDQDKMEDDEMQVSSPVRLDDRLPEQSPEQLQDQLPERLPGQLQVATPEATRLRNSAPDGFDDDFIASTPTPRRGQALTISVNDNDPPSSPPEPRRYPLLSELVARSRSSSSIDDWQFSSSPVSGSPMSARHTAPEPELSLEGIVGVEGGEEQEDLMTGTDKEILPRNVDRLEQEQTVSMAGSFETESAEPSQDGGADVSIADTTASVASESEPQLPVFASSQRTRRQKKVIPSTPRRRRHRSARLSAQNSTAFASESSPPVRASHHTLRPLSRDSTMGEAIMSSPLRTGPRSGRPRFKIMAAPTPLGDQSFRMSVGDENSMLRLAIELEQHRSVPAAPQSAEEASPLTTPNTDAHVLECITVSTGDESDNDSNVQLSPDSRLQSSAMRSFRSSRRRRMRVSSEAKANRSIRSPSEIPSTPTNRRILRPKTRSGANESPSKAKDDTMANTVPAPDETAEPQVPVTVTSPNLEEEVHSQLTQELHEHSERQVRAKTPGKRKKAEAGDADDEQADGRPTKKTRLTNIMSMLRSSLAILKTAALTRDEVHEVEDVCMDIKRELYDAELRGRQ